jgi:hypothetical protein
MAFAKLYENPNSQILITKVYGHETGKYGVKITTEAIINNVPCSLNATLEREGMDEKEMDELFDSFTEEKAIYTCNDLYSKLYKNKF